MSSLYAPTFLPDVGPFTSSQAHRTPIDRGNNTSAHGQRTTHQCYDTVDNTQDRATDVTRVNFCADRNLDPTSQAAERVLIPGALYARGYSPSLSSPPVTCLSLSPFLSLSLSPFPTPSLSLSLFLPFSSPFLFPPFSLSHPLPLSLSLSIFRAPVAVACLSLSRGHWPLALTRKIRR